MNRRNILWGVAQSNLSARPAALIYHAVLCCIFAVSLSIIHETQIPFTFFGIFWKNLKIGWFYVILYLLGPFPPLSRKEVSNIGFYHYQSHTVHRSKCNCLLHLQVAWWAVLQTQQALIHKHRNALGTAIPGAFLLSFPEVNSVGFLSISHLYYMRCLVKCQQFRTKLSAMPKPSPRGEGGTKCRMRWKPCGRWCPWSASDQIEKWILCQGLPY